MKQKLNPLTLSLDGAISISLVFRETWDLRETIVREIICWDMKVRQSLQRDRAKRVGAAILVQFQSSKQQEQVLNHSRAS